MENVSVAHANELPLPVLDGFRNLMAASGQQAVPRPEPKHQMRHNSPSSRRGRFKVSVFAAFRWARTTTRSRVSQRQPRTGWSRVLRVAGDDSMLLALQTGRCLLSWLLRRTGTARVPGVAKTVLQGRIEGFRSSSAACASSQHHRKSFAARFCTWAGVHKGLQGILEQCEAER